MSILKMALQAKKLYQEEVDIKMDGGVHQQQHHSQ